MSKTKGILCCVCGNEYNPNIYLFPEEVCSSSCKIEYYYIIMDINYELTRILEESK